VITSSDPGGSGEDITAVAAEIIVWQLAAHCLPLPDVRSLAIRLTSGLARALNDLNQVYGTGPGDSDRCPGLDIAVTGVVRQATAAAVFTLAARQRTRTAATAS
jgi:hypothetical protein